MKKIMKKSERSDKNKSNMRINYLCPTGMIPVFYSPYTNRKETK